MRGRRRGDTRLEVPVISCVRIRHGQGVSKFPAGMSEEDAVWFIVRQIPAVRRRAENESVRQLSDKSGSLNSCSDGRVRK